MMKNYAGMVSLNQSLFKTQDSKLGKEISTYNFSSINEAGNYSPDS
ncbi:Uncharacterised protein [Chlamydia abortus]|nr:Uncharacterised protein [Chlamydia trachomatis]SGA02536.1 Uncharacterised protein [Chlamydia abortus]SGA11265.1 Uncharacterised protein [Mycoplasmopsis arginini]CRH55472.1 Uncharacterised protein [Chlamydia trachomatis]SGA18737.1 Uncharacterised protein [Mycoplasmopsis arginini]